MATLSLCTVYGEARNAEKWEDRIPPKCWHKHAHLCTLIGAVSNSMFGLETEGSVIPYYETTFLSHDKIFTRFLWPQGSSTNWSTDNDGSSTRLHFFKDFLKRDAWCQNLINHPKYCMWLWILSVSPLCKYTVVYHVVVFVRVVLYSRPQKPRPSHDRDWGILRPRQDQTKAGRVSVETRTRLNQTVLYLTHLE